MIIPLKRNIHVDSRCLKQTAFKLNGKVFPDIGKAYKKNPIDNVSQARIAFKLKPGSESGYLPKPKSRRKSLLAKYGKVYGLKFIYMEQLQYIRHCDLETWL